MFYRGFRRIDCRCIIESVMQYGNQAIDSRISVSGEGNELTKGTEGFEIYDGFSPMAGEQVFDKYVNSPFKETGLLEYLREKEEKTIIAVGLQTDYCMDATVKCGFEHGFRIIVPENTNSTFDNEFMPAEKTCKYYNSFVWNKRYAECISFEKTLYLMKCRNCSESGKKA